MYIEDHTKRFLNGHFVEDVSNVDWNDVYSANDPEVSLTAFMDIFIEIVNRYTPMKKSIAKSIPKAKHRC